MAVTTLNLASTTATERRDGNEVVAVYKGQGTPTTAQVAISDAQGLGLPQIGQSFSSSIGNNSIFDSSVECDEIHARPTDAARTHWTFVVTFRHPSGINPSGGGVNPNIKLPPSQRTMEFWTETLVQPKQREFGFNLPEIRWPFLKNGDKTLGPEVRKPNTFGPITNAAGMKAETDALQVRLPIFVAQKSVTSPFSWIDINTDFELRTNDDTWDIFGTGKTVSAGTCLYWSIDSTRPQYFGSVRYFDLEVRVLYNPDGHELVVPNEGSQVWKKNIVQNGGVEWTLDTPYTGMIPREPPVLLDQIGQERENQAGTADNIIYRDLETTDFNELTRRLGLLS